MTNSSLRAAKDQMLQTGLKLTVPRLLGAPLGLSGSKGARNQKIGMPQIHPGVHKTGMLLGQRKRKKGQPRRCL